MKELIIFQIWLAIFLWDAAHSLTPRRQPVTTGTSVEFVAETPVDVKHS